jgi:hypothetical protein
MWAMTACGHADGTAPPWIGPRGGPASAAPPPCEAIPTGDWSTTCLGGGRARLWQGPDGPACPVGSAVASERGSVASARRARCGAGQTPERVASRTRAGTARPRRDGRSHGDGAARRSADRRPPGGGGQRFHAAAQDASGAVSSAMSGAPKGEGPIGSHLIAWSQRSSGLVELQSEAERRKSQVWQQL